MRSLVANLYINKITDLSHNYFINNKINMVLIDIDNTVINPETNEIIFGIENWVDSLKKKNITVCFVSNTYSVIKKIYLEEKLGVRVIIGASKPLNIGFKKARSKYLIPKEQIAMIGDQTFLDILGGNIEGFHTIKVNPLSSTMEDCSLSKACRWLEKLYQKLTIDERVALECLSEGKDVGISKKLIL